MIKPCSHLKFAWPNSWMVKRVLQYLSITTPNACSSIYTDTMFKKNIYIFYDIDLLLFYVWKTEIQSGLGHKSLHHADICVCSSGRMTEFRSCFYSGGKWCVCVCVCHSERQWVSEHLLSYSEKMDLHSCPKKGPATFSLVIKHGYLSLPRVRVQDGTIQTPSVSESNGLYREVGGQDHFQGRQILPLHPGLSPALPACTHPPSSCVLTKLIQ